MLKLKRIIVALDLTNRGIPRERRFEFRGIDFQVLEYPIGWDLKTAREVIRKYRTGVDAFALAGIRDALGGRTVGLSNFPVRQLFRAAGDVPTYTATALRNFFAEWTFGEQLRGQKEIFRNKRVLFHLALASPLVDTLEAAGGQIWAADALTLTGVPLLLKGKRALDRFVRASKISKYGYLFSGLKHLDSDRPVDSLRAKVQDPRRIEKTFQTWVRRADAVVTSLSRLESHEDFSCFQGKILITDSVTPGIRGRLVGAGVAEVIEYFPNHPALAEFKGVHPSVVSAMLDLAREMESGSTTFEEYLLNWIESADIRLASASPIYSAPVKVAFILHPLSGRHLWRGLGLDLVEKFPSKAQGTLEAVVSRLDPRPYGTITGIQSAVTGQRVICDLYGVPATPRQLLAMDEDCAYRSISKAVEMAARNGASLVGLGAYTKVIGDAGVTIARRASVPVTNGNSYSASATLWAARVAVEKLGLIAPRPGTSRLPAKALVIGATGSIGRVSALLLSRVFDEIVLSAPRPEKLLELRSEIRAFSPEARVQVAIDPNRYLPDCDLILTATSKPDGSVLDIGAVKPGAVICDCSRPLNVSEAEAALRPDVLVIESGEIDLPGEVHVPVDIGLPKPSVYACLAETVLLGMEKRFVNFSLSKQLSWERTKEIYRIGVKHGAGLSQIRGPLGVITDADIARCRELALAARGGAPARTAGAPSAWDELFSETPAAPESVV